MNWRSEEGLRLWDHSTVKISSNTQKIPGVKKLARSKIMADNDAFNGEKKNKDITSDRFTSQK